MKKSDTPEFEHLMDWLEGRLSTEGMQLVAAQVAMADTEVQEDVSWLRAFYRARQRIALGEPLTAVTEQLEQRFAAFAQSRRRPSGWRSLLATLSFDSHAQFATGVRTAVAPNDQRQLIFTVETATVVCTLQRRDRDRRFDLFGQFLSTTIAEVDLVRVHLLRGKKQFDHALTDDLGEFTLFALPAGFYDLILRNDQFQITISPLHLPI